jgi:hypothetical protein
VSTVDSQSTQERLRADDTGVPHFLGYFDGQISNERPGISEKSSWLKVTNVARLHQSLGCDHPVEQLPPRIASAATMSP